MVRLFMVGEEQGGGAEGGRFEPQGYESILERLSDLVGTGLEFTEESGSESVDQGACPIRLGGRRTGWAVRVVGPAGSDRRGAETAAEVISRLVTTDQDMTGLAVELAGRYEELNFLYDMAQRVGALLDEDQICSFVIQEAAWLLDCDRASIMVPDAESGVLRIRAAVGLPEDVTHDTTVQPGQGISGKVFESGRGVIVNSGDPMPAESLNLDELRESSCFLCVPLMFSAHSGAPEEVLGVINLTRKRRGSDFTAMDKKLVLAVARTAATQIYNCRLINAERERQRLEHELELAARIQLSLLPKEPLRAGAVEVAGCSRPSRHVGGDLFDYWLQDGRLCMVVADVSGHDMGAALMATAMRSVFRSEAGHRTTVAGLLQQVNNVMFTDLLRSELLVSAFYAELDPQDGTLTYCRAGHPKPLLVQADRRQWLDTPGLLLGLRRDGEFEELTVSLQPGDTLLAYTDGLMEARNPSDEEFGTGGVERVAMTTAELTPDEVSRRMVEAVRGFAGESPLTDDVTALVLRMGPPGGGR